MRRTATLKTLLLAAAASAFLKRTPAARPRTALAAKAGEKGRERAKKRLAEALAREKRQNAPAAPTAVKPKPTWTTDEDGNVVAVVAAAPPAADASLSRVEQRRRAGLPPLEPMLSKAPADPTGELEAEPLIEKLEMPRRWNKVPDCERPSRWREAMDDEDCEFEKTQKRMEAEAETKGEKIKDKNPYQELIPQLKTLEDFLAANANAQRREKAVVVKFYSRQCRACLRIAAKYRRLALELRDEIDCYEVESMASRPLVDGLNVTKVPSVQIYDPDGVTRLANSPCMPDDFPKVQRKVTTAIASMAKHRSIHKVVATSYADELCDRRRELLVSAAPAQPNAEVEKCGICPEDESIVYSSADEL